MGETYRERQLSKAARLRGWAGKRQAMAEVVFKQNEHLTRDHAFNTQPGHIPLRAKIIAQEDRQRASLALANGMESKAAEIEHQAGRAIYDDDPDAIEALETKIAKLTAEAELSVKINKAYRTGGIEAVRALGVKETLLNSITQTMEQCPWLRAPCDTTNTRANIRRLQQRLAGLAQ